MARLLAGLLLLLGLGGGAAEAHYVRLQGELAEPGRLTVGLALSGRPFAYRRDGRLLGFEAEIARTVAEAHGLELKLVQLPRSGLLEALARGEVDTVSSLPLAAGAKGLALLPYLGVGDHLLVLKGNPFRVSGLADLPGRTVAVTAGTTAEAFARALSADFAAAGKAAMDIHSFPEQRYTHVPVSMGHAAGYFLASLGAVTVSGDPASRVRLVEGAFRLDREVGFLVRPERENLRHAIEHALAAAVATGRYDRLLAAAGLPPELSLFRR